MSNPLNNNSLVGRLSQAIQTFVNKDGSKSILVNLAVDDNFKSLNKATGKTEVQTNYIPLRGYIGKDVQGNGSWDRVHVGDLVAVSTRINAKPYDDAQGVRQYPLTIELEGYPQFLESKAITEARAARKAVAADGAAAAPAEAQAPAAPVKTQAQLDIEAMEAQLAAARAAAPAAAAAVPAGGYENQNPFPG